MYVSGTNLVTDRYTGKQGTCMTWYHGVERPEFIFTGFGPWIYRASDCRQLFDFVLQQIWHITKTTGPAKLPELDARASRTTTTAGAPAAARAALPVPRRSGILLRPH
jgi:hypothetical protein